MKSECMKKKRSSRTGAQSPVRHDHRGRDGRFLRGKGGLPASCRHYSHGLRAMQRALAEVSHDDRWLDQLGDVGTAIRNWRTDIIEDLGGESEISAMQRVVIDSASKTYILLCSIDAWLLQQPSLVNKRNIAHRCRSATRAACRLASKVHGPARPGTKAQAGA